MLSFRMSLVTVNNAYLLNFWVVFIGLCKFFENRRKKEVRAEREGEEKGNKGSYIFLRIIFFPK